MKARSSAMVLDVEAGGLAELASRIRRLRIPVLHAKTHDEADRLLHAEGERVRAVLFAPSLDEGELALLRARVCERAIDGPPTLVAVGPRPTPDVRSRLRAAGVEHALWEPYDDGMLRFVVNEALAPADAIAAREGVRVPISVVGRVIVGGRSKLVHVYSLSSSGAFLETQRPSMRGAQLELEIPLPGGLLRAAAHVVFANVRGNLQRPKLPLGMGVRFEGLGERERSRLRRFVETRATRISV